MDLLKELLEFAASPSVLAAGDTLLERLLVAKLRHVGIFSGQACSVAVAGLPNSFQVRSRSQAALT